MTVAELIDELKQFPQDLEVHIGYEKICTPVSSVYETFTWMSDEKVPIVIIDEDEDEGSRHE